MNADVSCEISGSRLRGSSWIFSGMMVDVFYDTVCRFDNSTTNKAIEASVEKVGTQGL